MPTIRQKELINNLGQIVRRAEAGEEFTVTVAGRPAARLGPARPRQWVSGVDLHRVWETPAPKTLADDLADFPAKLVDPFDR